jgi:hypothetical protein
MPLKKFTIGHMPGLTKVVCSTIVMLRFPRVVHGTTSPLAPCGPEYMVPHPTSYNVPN